jgi:hypothetical protein
VRIGSPQFQRTAPLVCIVVIETGNVNEDTIHAAARACEEAREKE